MNITILYGSRDKTCTYNCVQLLLSNLKLNANIQTTEFFLTQNSVFYEYTSDDTRHAQKTNTLNNISIITKSLINSDLIIFASPVFECDISPEMKTVFKNLSLYISNNPSYNLHDKIGIAMSITTRAGLLNTIKTLKRNLNLLGIFNIFKYSQTLYETNWEYANEKLKIKFNGRLYELSNKILNTYRSIHTVTSPLYLEATYSKTTKLPS